MPEAQLYVAGYMTKATVIMAHVCMGGNGARIGGGAGCGQGMGSRDGHGVWV